MVKRNFPSYHLIRRRLHNGSRQPGRDQTVYYNSVHHCDEGESIYDETQFPEPAVGTNASREAAGAYKPKRHSNERQRMHGNHCPRYRFNLSGVKQPALSRVQDKSYHHTQRPRDQRQPTYANIFIHNRFDSRNET